MYLVKKTNNLEPKFDETLFITQLIGSAKEKLKELSKIYCNFKNNGVSRS